MPSFKSLAAAAATIAYVSAVPTTAKVTPPVPRIAPQDVPVNFFTNDAANGAPFLNNLAQAAGKLWFGTAADVPGPEQQDIKYMTILNDTRIFGQITPANYMKWQFTEPERNNFSYTGGDVAVNIAEDHGKYLRCHNLCWDNQNPQWLTNLVAGGVSNATMVSILQNHIANVVGHWGGRCYSWDVVNEAINGTTGGWDNQNPFYQVIGPAFFPIAFAAAEKAVKKTKANIQLVYNDYGIESAGTRGTGAINALRSLKQQGIQVDGVGFESHFEVGGTPSQAQLIAQMNAFIALDLDIYITELDVRFVNASAANAGGFAQQALDYYNVVSPFMQVDRCKGITVWDFQDSYSWIPSTFAGQGLATFYNATTYARKPAYQAVANALNNKKCGAPCANAVNPLA